MDTKITNIVVIPAHGRGSRIRELTAGHPKTLLEVAGQPILWRLLSAAARVPATLVLIYGPTDDAGIGHFLNKHDFQCNIELRYLAPQGYLKDMLTIGSHIGSRFSVLDADLLAPIPELENFIRQASDWPREKQLVAGITTKPKISDPRVIWLGPVEDKLADREFIVLTGTHTQKKEYRLAGAYHWQTHILHIAEHFASSGLNSFHDFMFAAMHHKTLIGGIELSVALNINTQADYEDAQAEVISWVGKGIE